MQAFQWCNKLYHNPPDDWEKAVLGFFEETYPLYPQEPLLLLIKSGAFLRDDDFEYRASNSASKLAYFVLLASKADCKRFFECMHNYDTLNKSVITTEI